MDFVHEMGLLALGTRFKRLGERLQAEVAKVLRAEGIEFGRRWGPLFYLLNVRGPTSIGEAAVLLGLTPSAVSLFSKEMAKAGLVGSGADAKDDRKRILAVTPVGGALHRRMLPILRDIETSMHGLVKEIGVDPISGLRAIEEALDRRSGFDRIREITIARTAGAIEIIDFAPEHRSAFKRLNLEWIDAYFGSEDLDLQVLDEPEREIIGKGGAIVYARLGEEIVGTCGLARIDSSTYELCKMAVSPAMRGRGVGERLGRAIIEKARSMGARKVVLETNHQLTAAIRLYRRLGFTDAPASRTSHYARTDTLMELHLDEAARITSH